MGWAILGEIIIETVVLVHTLVVAKVVEVEIEESMSSPLFVLNIITSTLEMVNTVIELCDNCGENSNP